MQIPPDTWLSALSFPRLETSRDSSQSTDSLAGATMASNDGDSSFMAASNDASNLEDFSFVASSGLISGIFEPNCSVTETKLYHFAHRWTVDNFAKLYYYNIGTATKFTSPHHEDLMFRLGIVPKGKDEGAEYVSISFMLEKCLKSSLNVRLQLSILDANNQKCNTQDYELEMSFTSTEHSNYTLDNFIHQEYLLDAANGLLPDDKFTIYAELSYDGECEDPDGPFDRAAVEKRCQASTIKDLTTWLEEGKLTDAILSLDGDKEFHLHKAILAARSPVFATMFGMSNGFDLKSETVRKITDIDQDVFVELIRYIYTGKVQELNLVADRLFLAADKYGLDGLKEMCEISLCATISVGNLPKLLKLANEYDATILKKRIIEYVQNYASSMISNNLLQSLDDYPDLFYDLFAQMMQIDLSEDKVFPPTSTQYQEESSWSHTKTRLTKFAHKWQLSDFASICSFKPEENTFVESSAFSPPTDCQLKLYLRLFPKGSNADVADYISLFLCVADYGDYAPKIQFKASIMDQSGDICNTEVARKGIYVKNLKMGWEKYILREALFGENAELMAGDKLTIYCEIEVMYDPLLVCGKIAPDLRSPQRLAQDMAVLLDSGNLSDVVFVVDGNREFRAHKAICGARSCIFATMFSSDMIESKENRVVITDVPADVFDELLKFIYTGKVSPSAIRCDAEALLAVAEKYQLETLKNVCELALIKNIRSETFGHLLLISDSYNAKYLKAKVIERMYNSDDRSMWSKTGTLKYALQSRPKLFQEALSYALKNLR